MMASRSRIGDVLEAAYAIGGSDQTWLMDVCRASLPLLDQGLGVGGSIVDVTGEKPCHLMSVVAGGPRGIMTAIERMTTEYGRTETEILRRRLNAQTVSEVLGPAFGGYRTFRHMRRIGIQDMIGVGGCDTVGQGVILGTPATAAMTLTRAQRRVYQKVAAHLVAAFRLRRAALRDASVSANLASRGQTEAIFTSGGRLEHALGPLSSSPSLRQSLRRAVVEIDRARAREAKLGSQGVLDVWQGLVGGRWSLMDLFERDGKRYVVARRNDPLVPQAARLSERERQVLWYVGAGHSLKCIAYELGLAYSSITTLLSRVAKRVTGGSRTRLLALGREVFEASRTSD